MKVLYYKEVVPAIMAARGLKNAFQVPRLEKIVINIGLSEARENVKVVDIADAELAAITGQKPKLCRSKKSISNFKLRQGMPIGLTVTLRGGRMYEFLERFISICIPRIRDFHGLNPHGFDGNGNYNLGLNEQYMFPEINLEKSDKARGMNITFVTNAAEDSIARDMLRAMGMPFKKTGTEAQSGKGTKELPV
jgi:large subunit ribosomal protein L5